MPPVKHADSARREISRQLLAAASLVASVLLIGATGYYVLGGGQWEWSNCVYMTVITLSTVGFAETLPNLADVAGARMWTMALIICGSGSLVFFVSVFTAFIVEGDIQGSIRRRRMQKEIDQLKNHVIVVGAGATGIHVVEELYETKEAFLVIDVSEDRMRRLEREMPGLRYVIGNATNDEVLEEAGIARARALATTLPEDKDNVFVAITARALNRNLRIVSKVTEDSADMKLKRAGADSTVSPSSIGGLRIASELVRPSVVRFLDTMLRDRTGALRVEEVQVPAHSTLAGARLSETNLRDRTRVLVLAARAVDGPYTYNPGPDFLLEAGMTLVVLSQLDDLAKMRAGIADGTIGKA